MTTLTHAQISELLGFAHHLCDVSGRAILPHFRVPLAVENKAAGSHYDPVTAADRAAEAAMRAEIARAHPDHAILGEEMGDDGMSAHSPMQWIIDPIDGTRAFIMGLPLWGTLLALAIDGRPRLGVMDQPFTGERFWGDGAAAYMRGPHGSIAEAPRRLRTRACPRLADAVLSSTHPDLFAPGDEAARFRRLTGEVRMTRYGGDCYGYCMVALGLVDLVVEAGLKPYDVAALVPIIEGAGGRVTGWDGRPALESSRIVACGDPGLHAEVVALLSH